jgi:hypothetical protein
LGAILDALIGILTAIDPHESDSSSTAGWIGHHVATKRYLTARFLRQCIIKALSYPAAVPSSYRNAEEENRGEYCSEYHRAHTVRH